MSLKSFLANKDVKEHFNQEFQLPVFAIRSELLAPPLSNRYSLVGTAFDYLMRFYLKKLNPDAVTSEWVAEHSISRPLSPLLNDVVIDSNTGKIISYTETELTKRATQIIEQAKLDYSEYLSSGQITDRLIETTLCLAQLDPIFRARIIDCSGPTKLDTTLRGRIDVQKRGSLCPQDGISVPNSRPRLCLN
jgi:hypothetical protein